MMHKYQCCECSSIYKTGDLTERCPMCDGINKFDLEGIRYILKIRKLEQISKKLEELKNGD